MTPWYLTSEGWATLITNLVGLAVLAGAITSAQGDVIKNAVQQIVGGIIALVPIIMFIKSRIDLKKTIVANMPQGAVDTETHMAALKHMGV